MRRVSVSEGAVGEVEAEASAGRAAAYRARLLSLAERDADRAVNEPGDTSARALALWMACEVERHAGDAGIGSAEAREMRERARALRERVRLAVPRAA